MSELLKLAAPLNKKELLARLQLIVKEGWLEMPTGVLRYNGTGGPGNYLEDLLGLTVGNQDIADIVGFEVKYHTSQTHLLTLFHKEPEPRGILRYMVSKYGWKDEQGRLSFRHTIHGQSDRFKVVDDAGNLIVRHLKDDGPIPMWSHNTLLNIAGGKLRRLIAMHGQRDKQKVKYNHAILYENLELTRLIENLVHGRMAIDFDVRESKAGSKSLRNHGTKFRVSLENLPKLYLKKTKLS